MMVAGKYVPPHMRTGAKLEPSVLPQKQSKTTKTSQKANWNSKTEKVKSSSKSKKEQKPQVVKEEVKPTTTIIKPHCELFLADLPPALRSLQTLAGFFHPYGEISNIQFIPAGKAFPAEVLKKNLINPAEFSKSNCAVIEFLTARVAKFVVGVLRKRIEGLNFRIGLLKSGLAEEMDHQKQRLTESIHTPSYQINKTQSSLLQEVNQTHQYSSEELSEFEASSRKQRGSLHFKHQSDQAYYTGSSESYTSQTSDSDLGRYDTSDDDADLLTLALKNGIKVIRDS